MSRANPNATERAALHFPCPTCLVNPPGWCITSGRAHSNHMKMLHIARRQLAKQAASAAPDSASSPPSSSPPPIRYNPQRSIDSHPVKAISVRYQTPLQD